VLGTDTKGISWSLGGGISEGGWLFNDIRSHGFESRREMAVERGSSL
jgi:hypothetical protein